MKVLSIICIVACLCELVAAFRSFPHVAVSASRRGSSIRMVSGEGERNTYAGYSIYKGKGALYVKPIPPTFTASGNSQKVDRNGALLFEFAPSGKGPKEYDWTKKATFSLSVSECGEVLRAKDIPSAEFLHDPGANSKLVFFKPRFYY